jgi:hypothetical protein
MLITVQPSFFASAMQIHSDTRHWGYFQLRRPNGEAKALLDRAHAISVANASALRI